MATTPPRTPGAQNPGKYPIPVGPQYLAYGEQPGFIYDPWRDGYFPDEKGRAEYYQSTGAAAPPLPGGEVRVGQDGKTYQRDPSAPGGWRDITPKKPGMVEQIGPLGVAAATYEGGKAIGSQIIGGAPGLLTGGGSGGAASTAGQVATSQAPGLLSSGAGAAGGGAQSIGAGGVTAAGDAVTAGGAQALSGQGAIGGQGMLGMTGANPLLGSAGIAAGAYTGYQQGAGLLNAVKGKDMSTIQKGALALPTFGASLVWDPIKNAFGWGSKDTWKTEGNRLRDLAESGTYIPENLISSMPTRGRSRDEMQRKDYAADYVGRDTAGNLVNNKFNMSRNEGDLTGEDIVGYAAFAENDPTWWNKTPEERLAIANGALAAGAVREHHGTIDVDWKKYTPVAPPQATPMPKGPQGKPPGAINQPPRRTQPRRSAPY